MPIKFRCPNAVCGRALTVGDEAAGRKGKCPGCGGTLVVPMATQEADDAPFEMELDAEPVPAPRGAPAPRSGAVATAAPVEPPPLRKTRPSGPAGDPDWDRAGAKGAGGPVISFDVFGLAWTHFRSRMATWILAVFVMGFALVGAEILVLLLGFVGGFVPFAGPVVLVAAIAFLVSAFAVIWGCAFRLALKQVDGAEIDLGDAFSSVGDTAPALALAGVVCALAIQIGMMMLIVPGVIIAGLMMFVIPAVIDGLGAIEAITQSVETLKRQWFVAPLFLVVNGMVMVSGLPFCFLGTLVTVPIFTLAIAIQYRRSFASGGVPRKLAIADPWADAVGERPRAAGSGKVPVWAWGLGSLAALTPVVLSAALFVGVAVGVQHAIVAIRQQREMQKPMGEVVFDLKRLDQAPGAVPPPMVVEAPQPEPAEAPEPAPKPKSKPVRALAKAPATAPLNPVDQALQNVKLGGMRRVTGIRALATQPADDDHRAAVVAAVAPLLQDNAVCLDAAMALAQWAGSDDVSTLIDHLDSPQAQVRVHLIRALGRLKDEAAVPALVERMKELLDRGTAAAALLEIGPAAAPRVRTLLGSGDANVRRAATDLLKKLGANDAEGSQLANTLATIKSPDTRQRDQALQALSQMPADDSSRAQVMGAVLPLLESPTPSTRRRAVKVVETWGTTKEVPYLIEALNDKDRNVRATAIAALTRIPDPRSALALVRMLEFPEVRRNATDALVALKPQDPQIETLVLKALRSQDRFTREAACKILQVIGTSNSIAALKAATLDDHKNVGAAARAALSAINAKSNARSEKAG